MNTSILFNGVNNLKVHSISSPDNAWPWEKGPRLKAVDGVNLTFEAKRGRGCGIVAVNHTRRALLRLYPLRKKWCGLADLTDLDKKTRFAANARAANDLSDPLPLWSVWRWATFVRRAPQSLTRLFKTRLKTEVRKFWSQLLVPNVINRYPHCVFRWQLPTYWHCPCWFWTKVSVCDEPVSVWMYHQVSGHY